MDYVAAGVTTISFLQSSILFAVMVFVLAVHTRADDFLRVLREPRDLLLALAMQQLLYPVFIVICTTVMMMPLGQSTSLYVISLMPALAVGSLFTWVARGDVALSLLLVLFSGFISALATPTLINIWANWNPAAAFDAAVGGYTPIYSLMVGTLVVLLPTVLGQLTRHYFPGSERLASPALGLLTVICIAIPSAVIFSNFENLFFSFLHTGLQIMLLMMGLILYMRHFALAFKIPITRANTIALTIPVQTVSVAAMFSIYGLGAESGQVAAGSWWIIFEYAIVLIVALHMRES